MDILDELKYQLSNADEGSATTRDLVENPVAVAYLAVLLLFGGGLAYLAYQDTQIEKRKAAALKEQMAAAEMLRAQGLEREAAILDKDLKQEKRKPKVESANKPLDILKNGFQQPQNYVPEEEEGNRFERRQGRAARKRKKDKRKRK